MDVLLPNLIKDGDEDKEQCLEIMSMKMPSVYEYSRDYAIICISLA